MDLDEPGIVDEGFIEYLQDNLTKVGKRKRGKYDVYTDKDRYDIGKYANENGSIAAVRRFKITFDKCNESTVRGLKKMYLEQSAVAAKQGRTISTVTINQRGRSHLLGDKLDNLVQEYIRAQSNRGDTISRNLVTCVAKMLITRNPGIVGGIDLEFSHYAQSVLRCMGFRRRVQTTAKLEIPCGAKREAELVYHYDIVKKVETFSIPPELVIVFDQTPSKYAPTIDVLYT